MFVRMIVTRWQQDTHRDDSSVVAVEPDPVCGVGAVEFQLQHVQGWVAPRFIAKADLFDDTPDEPVTEGLAQPIGQVLQSRLALPTILVLVSAG